MAVLPCSGAHYPILSLPPRSASDRPDDFCSVKEYSAAQFGSYSMGKVHGEENKHDKSVFEDNAQGRGGSLQAP